MSAICHGTAWGLLQYFESAPTSNPTRARLTPALMPEPVVQVAVWAVEFYLGAIQYHAALFGSGRGGGSRTSEVLQDGHVGYVGKSTKVDLTESPSRSDSVAFSCIFCGSTSGRSKRHILSRETRAEFRISGPVSIFVGGPDRTERSRRSGFSTRNAAVARRIDGATRPEQ